MKAGAVAALAAGPAGRPCPEPVIVVGVIVATSRGRLAPRPVDTGARSFAAPIHGCVTMRRWVRHDRLLGRAARGRAPGARQSLQLTLLPSDREAPGVGDPHVRIGYAFGTRTRLNDDGFATVVDALERLGFDSLWLSERIGGEAPDPLVGMAFAAGRTTQVEVRDERDGAARSQPDRARQGAGHARPAVERPPAAGLRARRCRPARAAGVRRRTRRPGEVLRRGAGRAARRVGRRTC